MAEIKPISQLDVATTVGSPDQIVINKSEGASFKTSVIVPGNFGPAIGPYIRIGDISNVSAASPTINQVLKWDGNFWKPADDDSGTNTYTLPIASDTVLGGVKIGNNVDISVDGKISIADYLPLTGGAVTGNITASGAGNFGTMTVTGASSMDTLVMSGVITFAAGQTFPGVQGAVTSVNGDTGAVVLSADDVGAVPKSGGTMTGGLAGTTGTFSGDVTAANITTVTNNVTSIDAALSAIKAAAADGSTDLAGFKAAIATALASF